MLISLFASIFVCKITLTTQTSEIICQQFLNIEEWTSNRDNVLKKLANSGGSDPALRTHYQYLLDPITMTRFCKPVIGVNVKQNLFSYKKKIHFAKYLDTTNKCGDSGSTLLTFVKDFMDYFHLRSISWIHDIKGDYRV